VARDSINVTLRLAANPDSATLRGTLTVPTRAGIAEFSDVWIDHASQGYRVIAEASALSSDTSSAFSMVAPRPFERSVIAASDLSTCALDASAAAWCWGDNVDGQLGEGRVLSSPTPVPVAGNLRFSAITVDPGIDDEINDLLSVMIACGLTTGGAIACWGGAGSAFEGADGGIPQVISESRTFLAIDNNSPWCALASDGTLWCWSVGHGPRQLTADLRFVSLSGGCGLTPAGKAYCWGRGTLGNGQWNNRDTVVAVAGDHVFRTITGGGSHHCGVDVAGVTWCWGWAQHPFRGDGSRNIEALEPVRLPGAPAFHVLSAAGSGTCGLDDDDRLWCWGDTLSLLSGVPRFAKISLGHAGSCGLTADGQAWCLSTPLPTSERFTSISPGWGATCGVTTTGEGRCWGSNRAGQLADGHPLRSPRPVRVVGGKTFASLSGGGDAMCGLTASDETWCWGSVAEVAGTRFTTPQRLSEDPRFKVISVNGYNGCGIDANRQGWCWGSGATVGNGSVVGQLTAPVPIVGNLRLSAITVGDHVCALTVSGDAYCWGQNLWPMAGGWAATPTLVEGGFKFVAITGGWFYNCALTAAGEAYCWGQNISGQLGTTPPGSTAVPRPVTGGLRFSMISAGLGMTCGVTLDHNGYCWGADQPDNSTSSAPKPVPGGLSFTRIDVSTPSVFGSQWYGHACGTTLDGTIYCWGANSRGQLGNGQVDTSAVTTPTRVLGLKARH
jgi:alpha-tubulin suppressor-like RCC1 family protein